MPIKAKTQTRTPDVEPGMYIARCYEIIHMGTAFNQYLKKDIDEVRFSWEFPGEMKVFSEEKGEQPIVVSESYTLSMYDNANLRSIVEGWMGKSMTNDEADEFDVESLIGKTCMINVVHQTSKKGSTFAKVKSVNPVPKGTKVPKQINDTSTFNFNDAFIPDVENHFPGFISDRIKESEEYQQRINELMGEEHEQKLESAADDTKVDPETGLPF